MLVSANDAFCDSNKEIPGNNSSNQLEHYHSRPIHPQRSYRSVETNEHSNLHNHFQHKGKHNRSNSNPPTQSIFDNYTTMEFVNTSGAPNTFTPSSSSTWSQAPPMANTSTPSQDWHSHLFGSGPMFTGYEIPNQLEYKSISPNEVENTVISKSTRRSNDYKWNEASRNSAISRESHGVPNYSYGFDADIYASTFRLLNDESHANNEPLAQRPQYPVYDLSSQSTNEIYHTQLQSYRSSNWNQPTSAGKPQQPSTPSRNVSSNYGGADIREKVVPSRNQIDVWKISQGYDTRTTFMIRNIPNRYTQKMLLECLDETHKGEYDFVYLRMDFKNHCNVGYAFINFMDVGAVLSFIEKRVGRKWSKFNSDKICHLSYANIQGKLALIEKFRNSSVMEKDPSYQPKIFYSSGPLRGIEEPFPIPGRILTSNEKGSTETLPSPNRANAQQAELSTLGSAITLQQPQPPCSKPFHKLDWRVDWQEFDSDTDSGISNSLEDSLDSSFTNLSISGNGGIYGCQPMCKK